MIRYERRNQHPTIFVRTLLRPYVARAKKRNEEHRDRKEQIGCIAPRSMTYVRLHHFITRSPLRRFSGTIIKAPARLPLTFSTPI